MSGRTRRIVAVVGFSLTNLAARCRIPSLNPPQRVVVLRRVMDTSAVLAVADDVDFEGFIEGDVEAAVHIHGAHAASLDARRFSCHSSRSVSNQQSARPPSLARNGFGKSG